MQTVIAIVQVLLGCFFVVMSGGSKVLQTGRPVAELNRLGISKPMQVSIGLSEVAAGVALLLGVWWPPLAVLGGAWIACTMVGAAFTHWRHDDQFRDWAMVLVLFLLAVVVVWHALLAPVGSR